ncbi:hypothetical protein MHU86_1160 [Fragilaria crotonensis]|nr:hypothetical protein MHU86_1160 [Fragilaria crotonensis]
MVPDSVLEVNEPAGMSKEGCHAGRGMDSRAQLIDVGSARIEADLTRSWLTASPRRPIIPRMGHNVAHNGLIGPIRGSDGVGDAATGSEVGVGDAISERSGRRIRKGLE